MKGQVTSLSTLKRRMRLLVSPVSAAMAMKTEDEFRAEKGQSPIMAGLGALAENFGRIHASLERSKTQGSFVLELSEEEAFVRQLAKELKMPLVDVEEIHKKFKKVDGDQSGHICKDEFKELIVSQFPEGVVPRKAQLDGYWIEVDSDSSGEISFEEFLLWYVQTGGIAGAVS